MSTSPFAEIQEIQEAQREGCVLEHKPAVATPRTDAACWMQDWEGYRGEIINSNFSRQLERELAEKDAQILALREALKYAHDSMLNWFSSEYANDPRTAKVTAALSTPPPPVAPLEDVRPLVGAINSLLKLVECPDDHKEWNSCEFCDGKEAAQKELSNFLTQHPLP